MAFMDWLHLCAPCVEDMSSTSADYWACLCKEAERWYAGFISADPVTRLTLNPVPSYELQDVRWSRLAKRLESLLIAACPGGIQGSPLGLEGGSTTPKRLRGYLSPKPAEGFFFAKVWLGPVLLQSQSPSRKNSWQGGSKLLWGSSADCILCMPLVESRNESRGFSSFNLLHKHHRRTKPLKSSGSGSVGYCELKPWEEPLLIQ